MSFAIGRGFADVQIQKKNETSPISRAVWNILKQKNAYALILTSSSPRHCGMSIVIGLGFAEVKILKK